MHCWEKNTPPSPSDQSEHSSAANTFSLQTIAALYQNKRFLLLSEAFKLKAFLRQQRQRYFNQISEGKKGNQSIFAFLVTNVLYSMLP